MKCLYIAGAPRSGTSWLGQLFNIHPQVAYRFQPLFSYAFKARLSPKSGKNDIESFYQDLLDTTDEFVLQTKNISGRNNQTFRKEDPSLLVIKEVRYHYVLSNLLEAHPETQILAIVRNPCAAIHSWLKAPKEFDQDWDIMEEWRFASKKNKNLSEEFNGFEKWKELTLMFHRLVEKYPERIRLVRYEDLVNETRLILSDLFAFAGLEAHGQTTSFIKESTSVASSDPYGVHRNNIDLQAWMGQLPMKIVQEIKDDLAGGPLEIYL